MKMNDSGNIFTQFFAWVYLDAANFPGSTNPSADPTMFTLQTFWLDTKTSEDDEVVTWSLSSPADLQNLVIPSRQITSLCEWALRGQYRSGDGCTYNGAAYFDAKGNAVADPALDVCGGCLSDCRKRFGAGLAEQNTAVLDFWWLPRNRAFFPIIGHQYE
ncbi:phage minor tail protein L [Kluyvera cryocrescens]|uniref:Phage minor tail protein L n=1 Tax=Kluyvera cryocrescens TaxID=580 RepID=A0A485A5A0_KLUCR|nr:phage minor tail protein L [Kluyvera cryocrescens]